MSEMRRSFVPQTPPKLPILILADVSDSMTLPMGADEKRKIDALNDGIEELIVGCASITNPRAQIFVSVVTFGGGEANLAMELTPAVSAQWSPASARGGTPLGAAFAKAVELLDDRDRFQTRDYRPVLLLLSDGQPNDEWRGPLTQLNASRAGKADRFAVAIGPDAVRSVLNEFLAPAIASTEASGRLFEVGTEHRMAAVFQFVSNWSKARSSNPNPDDGPGIDRDDLDEV
jgi:uncharacterized protein YegL